MTAQDLTLEQIASDAIQQALAGGASDAECTISEGEEFSVSVRMQEVENLKEAGSRGAGIRVLTGDKGAQRAGSSYTSDLSPEGIQKMVKAALELAKITRPVRGASLIGNGPEALKYVSMVGNDLKLDEGIGTCGKEGQSVPVGVGIPTVKIDKMTVGGTAA